MSSAGRAASSSGCVARPRGHEIGLTGYAESIQPSSPTGSSVMETAEHREPYESRGSRTDLGAPGGESPPGDSTTASNIGAHRAKSVSVREMGFFGGHDVSITRETAGMELVVSPLSRPIRRRSLAALL